MSFLLHRIVLLSFAASVAVIQGCDTAPDSAPADVHADHDHDHNHESGKAHDEHAHPTEGPHHGLLVELGNEEYHAEIVHDDAGGRLLVYLLDSSAKQPATSEMSELTINVKQADKPAQFKLSATDAATNSEGKYSEFALASKELLDALHEKSSSARLSVTIQGQPYSGEVPHEGHAAHDHAH